LSGCGGSAANFSLSSDPDIGTAPEFMAIRDSGQLLNGALIGAGHTLSGLPGAPTTAGRDATYLATATRHVDLGDD
jgi:hypothetical protein